MDKLIIAIEISKFFEIHLESMGADGRGLHEKITSIEDQLPAELVKGLRKIATIRNKEVHAGNSGFDEKKFVSDALTLALNLGQLDPECIETDDRHIQEPIYIPKISRKFIETLEVQDAKRAELSDEGFREKVVEARISAEPVEGDSRENPNDQLNSALPKRIAGDDFTSEDIVSLLKESRLGISESEIKSLSEEALMQASTAPYKIHAATNAFIYIAKQHLEDFDAVFDSLALALLANGSKFEIPVLARRLLPKSYIESKWEYISSQHLRKSVA